MTKARVRESFTKMIDSALSANIVPVVTTELTIRGPDGWSEGTMKWFGALLGKESYQGFVNRHVGELSDWLREYAQERRVILLDRDRDLVDTDSVLKRKYTSEDGSHLTPVAYAHLTDYTLRRMRNRGPASPPTTP